MARILIVEDEEKIARFVTLELEHEGYQVEHAADGRTAVDLALERNYDLILLDVLLPQLNGMEVLRRVRKHKDVPVIMVTARDAVMDKVAGLDAGADDYLTKPFAIEELFARIRAALKRSEAVRAASGVGGASAGAGVASDTAAGIATISPATDTVQTAATPSPAALTVGSVALDPDRREVTVGGSPIVLTAREFDVLALLMAHAGTVLTRERIAHEALGYEYVGDTNNVDVHIAHLRAASRTPAVPASSRPCAGWAMSAARNAEAKRVTSIARAINWSYMAPPDELRLPDLLLVVIAAAILVYGYNQTLPGQRVYRRIIPGATVRGMSLKPARGWDLTTLTYTVELARTTKTFPLAQDLIALWPLYIVVVGWQVISMLDMLGGARRVRRTMALLNDLALRVDESSAACSSPAARWKRWSKPSSARASTCSSVTTGDADLASIEVALNRLLRQMQEAGRSRCALSTMQATSCARPSR